jgi:hypothetical protein
MTIHQTDFELETMLNFLLSAGGKGGLKPSTTIDKIGRIRKPLAATCVLPESPARTCGKSDSIQKAKQQ